MLGRVSSIALVLLVSLPPIHSGAIDNFFVITAKSEITEIVDGINEVRSKIALGNIVSVINKLQNQSSRTSNEKLLNYTAKFNQSMAYYRKVHYLKGHSTELLDSKMKCDSDTWTWISDDMLIMTFKRYTIVPDSFEQKKNFEKYNVAWPYLEKIIAHISQLSDQEFASYSVLHESLYSVSCRQEGLIKETIEHSTREGVCMKCLFKGKAIKDTNFQFGEKCSKCTKKCADDGLCDEGSSSNNTIYVSILILIAAYLLN